MPGSESRVVSAPIRPRTIAAPVAVVVVAVAAAALLSIADAIGFVTAAAEGAFVALKLAGAVLLVWAIIIAAIYSGTIIRRFAKRSPVSTLELTMWIVSLAAVAVVMIAHPLWGSGGSGA